VKISETATGPDSTGSRCQPASMIAAVTVARHGRSRLLDSIITPRPT
jgi:hypothetical protein